MTELDFDELDKAVNSLMSDKNTPTQPEATLATPSIPIPPPETTSVSVSSTPSAPTSSPSTIRPTPPAARRGGKFMDVVPAAARREATPPVSRQGVTMQPSSAFTPSTPSSTLPPKDDMPEPAKEESAATSPVSTDWPDPLELAGTKKEETAVSDGSGSPITSFSESPVLAGKTPEEETSSPEPLSSPFLPDAKVEKRPLGGVALESAGELMIEDENAQLPALPKDVEPALPDELHGDVVSIEADDSTTGPAKHAEAAHDLPAEKTGVAQKAELKPKIPEVTVTEAAIPVGPASIPQQYREEPNTGDQKNGAIYDTDSYHQPLSHPAKKKSGWSWVLWILVILLVGASGGAALYLLGIF